MNKEVSGKWLLLLKAQSHKNENWYEAFTYENQAEAEKQGAQICGKFPDYFINQFMVIPVGKLSNFTTKKIKK